MESIESQGHPTVLVTGGAGYVGSHTAYLLFQTGFRVIILDNFSQKQSISFPWAEVIRADFSEAAVLQEIFITHEIQAVFHFAASIEVGESVKNPRLFYANNVSKALVLLNTMLDNGVTQFIFSSTCAVYGEPQYMPMNEQHPRSPMSPYGKTKLAMEFILEDYAQAYGLSYVGLRYFNAAGSLWESGLGEWHSPETHLIPRVINAVLRDEPVYIFGDDYQTHDGTCIRDYVHVVDLARAHVLAYEALRAQPHKIFLNAGTGRGFSVREVIDEVGRVCDKKPKIEVMPARAGDAPVLIADTALAQKILGWKPYYSDLKNIISSAYAWNEHRLSHRGERVEHF